MTFLKQWATRDTGGSEPYATGRLVPNTEPTTTHYVNWKAKEYSTTTRVFPKGTRTGYKNGYGFGAMWKFHKSLRRSSKLGATAMAA